MNRTNREQNSAEFYAKLGSRIRQANAGVGLTQGAVVALVGLTCTSMTNIEKGRLKALLHTLCRLTEVLGVQPLDLLQSRQKTAAGTRG